MDNFTIYQAMALLGLADHGFSVYSVNGEPHYLASDFLPSIGLANSTQAIKGRGRTPKLQFHRDYKREYIPEVNFSQRVYLLTGSGIIQVIKKNNNPMTRHLQEVLAEEGI